MKLLVCLEGQVAGTLDVTGSRTHLTYSDSWLSVNCTLTGDVNVGEFPEAVLRQPTSSSRSPTILTASPRTSTFASRLPDGLASPLLIPNGDQSVESRPLSRIGTIDWN
jgi:hypothetical protein